MKMYNGIDLDTLSNDELHLLLSDKVRNEFAVVREQIDDEPFLTTGDYLKYLLWDMLSWTLAKESFTDEQLKLLIMQETPANDLISKFSSEWETEFQKIIDKDILGEVNSLEMNEIFK